MTKALQLCRSFHAAGHRVVLVESREVPPHRAPLLPRRRRLPHRARPARRRLRRGAARRRRGRGRRRLRAGVQPRGQPRPTHAAKRAARRALRGAAPRAASRSSMLDDKHAFAATAAVARPRRCPTRTGSPTRSRSLDFDFDRGRGAALHPQEHRLRPRAPPRPDPAAVRPDAARRWRRSCAPRPISPDNPWILQEFVEGQEYCTHGTVRDGRLPGLRCAASPRPSRSTTRWSTSRAIGSWVETFVGALGLTGQVSLRLHRGRGRHAVRHRVQPAHPLGDHDVPRPPGRRRGLPRRAGRAGARRSAPRRAAARRTGSTTRLWRLLAGPDRAASGCARSLARQGRDLRPRRPAAVPAGAPPADPARCCSRSLRRRGRGSASTSTSASSSSRR